MGIDNRNKIRQPYKTSIETCNGSGMIVVQFNIDYI